MSSTTKQPVPLSVHLVAGGVAGLSEALSSISRSRKFAGSPGAGKNIASAAANAAPQKPDNFIRVGAGIFKKEGGLALYKGLGAVIIGIVPKMAIRFSSFEFYKSIQTKEGQKLGMGAIFMAGLGAGITEAVMVVTPTDVIKIRLQAQRHSLSDPLDVPKYRNAAHAAYTIIREEGFGALYKGVTLTALRQATNQATNFTIYHLIKNKMMSIQNVDELPSYQHMIIGGISGAMGPLSNAPIDTVKTRIQKSKAEPGVSGFTRFVNISKGIIKNEGYAAFYKGITPRVLRVAPGQSVTFMVYEKVKNWIEILNDKSAAYL
ncbi:Succinate/fumarate mitochondrial transporter [Smittium culicis]|uniref:Succinate/fumarate mitochondrial transporter n=1 Tax=Smittium culicis TaxID=133412 RepID=A0A1R1Y0N3_9FUNG|nr:Succinate/fumarate mitochondrial transporter [Smittium culicis]